MKRRPKLSLEPDQQVRREPPKGFSSLEGTGPTATEKVSNAARSSKAANKPSEATGPTVGAASPRPAPAPTGNAPGTRSASPAAPAPRSTRFDGATVGKILLAIGVAALSILLLKRRFG